MSLVPAAPVTDQVTPTLRKRSPLKLRVEEGPDHGREFVLERGTYLLGKGEENEFILSDPAVSRSHLLIEVLAGAVRFSDRGSTNGSLCDGLRFSTIEAQAGSRVQVGRTVMRLLARAERTAALAPSSATHFGALRGESLPMRQTFAALERLAGADPDVLLQGETGTGKELCALALHARSARSAGPFVICDVSALGQGLLEAQLFGHVRGAFIGAIADQPGLLARAHGGTLFLDEVGELPLESQPRLLRFLESREVRAVGAGSARKVSVRVIAATHRDLAARVAAGQFREDLYHRLAVLCVRLPPLRERAGDVPLLLDEALAEAGHPPSLISEESRALLSDYPWPGNVRELRNLVREAVHLGEATALASRGLPGGASGAGLAAGPFKGAKEEMIQAFERDYLRSLLATCQGNIKRASERSGIDRVHLYRLLKKHGLGRAT